MADDGRRAAAAYQDAERPVASSRTRRAAETISEHLLSAVREIEPSVSEWRAVIDFLTETGQISERRRQEYLLLSDVLGVSALVDAINTRRPPGATENTVIGPCYVSGAPRRPQGATIAETPIGEPLVMRLRIVDVGGAAISGARVDVWHASGDGFYENQQPDQQAEHNLRGVFQSDEDGLVWCRSVKPAGYPLPTDGPVGRLMRQLGRSATRPAHVHLIISASGFETLTTHVFDAADLRISDDPIFAVKRALPTPFVRIDDDAEARKWAVSAPFWKFDVTLALADARPVEPKVGNLQ